MNTFSKAFIVTILVLIGSLNLHSQDPGFIGFSTTHTTYDDGVETWDVFDVYANFTGEGYTLLSVFDSEVSSNDNEGFHHNDLSDGVGGSWKPSFSLDIDNFTDSNRDSYVNLGYGVGAGAGVNQTQLDPSFGSGTGPDIPVGAGWYTGDPGNPMWSIFGQVHVGQFVTESFRSVYFTFEATVAYNEGPSTGVVFGSGSTEFAAGVVTGCTVTSACNYDSTATEDDGSCVLPNGCTDSTACNYDSTATCDDGSCITDSLVITTTLCSEAAEVRMSGPWWNWDPAGGPIAENNGDGTWTFTFCPAPTADMEYLLVVDGVYEDLINAPHPDIDGDGYGDLWGCAPITDYWSYANRQWIVGSGDVANTAGTCGSCSDVYGCMDMTACNYDSAADVMDYFVCLYEDACGNCGGSDTAGCTDSTASNYDSTATCDDGSCVFLDGCTYAAATNYDSTATTDDGSCVFEVCDITSNDQDVYDQGYADGVASVPVDNCPEDLDNDGLINVADLLVFLSAYGNICE